MASSKNSSDDSGFHPPPAVSASLPTVLDTSCSEEDVTAAAIAQKFKTIIESDLASTQASSVKATPSSSGAQQQQQHPRKNQQRSNRRPRGRQQQHRRRGGSDHCQPVIAYGQNSFHHRAAIIHQQLEELMRLCNHEHQSNESYFHSITALLKMMQEVRGISPSSSNNSGLHSADLVASITSTLPSPPIDPNAAFQLTRRIEVPENPTFNLIGRILGPRGMTLREMESRFRCRIYVRGEGSIRDPAKAKKLLDQPGWEHLRDTLHVFVIAAGDDEAEVENRLDGAADFIERLLHPRGFDSFKRRQLVSLALINGNFRRPRQQQQHPQQQEPRQMNHYHHPQQHPHHHSMQNQIGVH